MIAKILQSIVFAILGLVVSIVTTAILAVIALAGVACFIAVAPIMWIATTVLGVMFPWAE